MHGDIGRRGAKKAPCRPFRPYDAFVGALPKIFCAYLNFTKRYGMTRVCHLEMQNGVLCGLRFRCKYALCLVFTAFDFFENIYLHNIPT